MNLKKLVPISDHFPYFAFPRKKVVSGFGLGVVSFSIVVCVVFFNVSFKNPISNYFVSQGSNVSNGSSVISWPFSLRRTTPFSLNATSFVKNGENPHGELISESRVESNSSDEKFVEIGDAHFSNFTKNGSFEKVLGLKGTQMVNLTGDVKNGKSDDLEGTHLSNFTNDMKNGSFDAISEKPFDINPNLDLKSGANGVLMLRNYSSSYGECDIFNGRWVRDDTKPYYPAGSCPYVDRDFDCHLNKRPDDEYVKWKWQPFECEIPREDYYQEGDHVYPRLKVLDAYRRALSTWARWVDTNIDTNKTQVIFRGYSVTHFKGGQWNSGGKCHKETQPIFNTSHLTKYPSKMRAFDNVLRGMKTPVVYLNISRLTDYRKDGHPSIYRMAYKTEEEQIAAELSQDCSHWCLPGVPDT
ncbi:PC-Esterase [Cynara cardunculus var. scolymus]|uniref:PC-Esterase n=1 Tax=Cynara cardunculus var. scolymus TaxID=59895 RepID=A0A118JYE5_CYNCS|nr:PC-Esterase [Cynara cardunculus var. scolymus]